jgi:hypothetical protein
MDFLDFFEIFWTFLTIYDIIAYFGLLWTAMGTTLDSSSASPTFSSPWTTMEFYGLFWTFMDFYGLLWTFFYLLTILDYFGLFWAFLVRGLLWTFMDFFELF